MDEEAMYECTVAEDVGLFLVGFMRLVFLVTLIAIERFHVKQ